MSADGGGETASAALVDEEVLKSTSPTEKNKREDEVSDTQGVEFASSEAEILSENTFLLKK